MESYRKKAKALFMRLHTRLKKKVYFLNGNLYEYLGVGVIFFVLTLVLTNFTLLHGSQRLFVDGPGDGTAGFLWFNTVEADANPILGHTDMANYPEGENLFNPTQVTYTLVWSSLWVLSKIFGPVMGLNIVTFMGIYLCAIVMYWLVKRLINNPYIAVFAGYAAAFIPYHLVKSSSHLTYIFSVVFILMLAAFIGYWKWPTTKRAILLAVSVAIAFYTDGYFILIGTVFMACLVMAGILYDVARKDIKSSWLIKIKHAGVAVGVLGLALVPIGLTQLSQGSGVDKFLSGARGSIQFDIEHYSTRPIDFLMPSSINPFFTGNEDFNSLARLQNMRSNTSENNTYIGYVVILLIVVGGTLLATHYLLKKKSYLSKINFPYLESYKLIFLVGIVTTPVMVWCMLSPSFTLFGYPVVVLSDILLHYDISLWRVMARFYLPLHVVLVVVASMALAAITYPLFSRKEKSTRKYKIRYAIGTSVVIALLGLTGIEYATSLSGTSYDFGNIPKVYTKIKDDNDIKVIAELPLMDRPLSTNYDFATAQLVHGKKLINTPLTNIVPGTRTALGTTIEAIDYAVIRGADTIITHNLECREQTWGRLKYEDKNTVKSRESSYYGKPICVYSVNDSYLPDGYFAKLKYGTFSDAPYIQKPSKEYQSLYMRDGWLTIVDQFSKSPTAGTASFTANIQNTPEAKKSHGVRWELYQGDRKLSEGSIPGRIESPSVDVTKELHIRIIDPMVSINTPFAISLSEIVVTKVD